MPGTNVGSLIDRLRPRAGRPEADVEEELRALRRKLKKRGARVKRLEKALKETRESLRDPWPDLGLDDDLESCIRAVSEEKLSYLGGPHLRVLAKAVKELEQAQRPGLIIEAGTARGGSAIVMARAKSAQRPMKVYDVFGMIPPPTDKDGDDVHARYAAISRGESSGRGGEVYYGYRTDLYREVTDSFARHGVPAEESNVELVQGLFQETIDLDEPVALAHLDGDWYESTMVCLERIAPLVVPGGRIVVDDYYAWSGCQTAVDEYFTGRSGFRLERRAKLHVVRT